MEHLACTDRKSARLGALVAPENAVAAAAAALVLVVSAPAVVEYPVADLLERLLVVDACVGVALAEVEAASPLHLEESSFHANVTE